jgi:DNA uptake protein ComE-like DNA-binding protein
VRDCHEDLSMQRRALMMINRIVAVMAILALFSTPVLAQATQPAASPPAKAAAKAPKKSPAAITTKVNLNTADAKELDKLPQIGPARAKAIVDARAKGPFKGWDDFVARKVVPANAQKAIKDYVTF